MFPSCGSERCGVVAPGQERLGLGLRSPLRLNYVGECQHTPLVWQPELSALTSLKGLSPCRGTQSESTQVKPHL